MMHHGFLTIQEIVVDDASWVSDNSGNSSYLKMSGTKPKETASYPNRTDTLFTKLQKHGGLECHETNAP